jgi:CRP/FNR family transcriptional regulator, cyclic AMP receptor protein
MLWYDATLPTSTSEFVGHIDMLTRFQDQRVLVEAVQHQHFVCGSTKFAEGLAAVGKLEEWAPGVEITKQGGSDRDLFLILLGQFSILVNGREMAIRTAGQHVGEMALIDSGALRSATVIAREQSVTLRISEADFTKLADEHPYAWRRLGAELADRLRQRGRFVRTRNPTPIVFIGSSTESKPIVDAICVELQRDSFIVRPWTSGIFGASHFPIDDLKTQLDESDFAVLVIGPDDKVSSRGASFLAPRDNVIFELGLFMGALGRERTFIVQERGRNLKIPSDLLGLGTIRFESDAPSFSNRVSGLLGRKIPKVSPLSSRIVDACNAIREKVDQLRAR